MKTKVKVHFADLISPDCWWPSPYSIEQAFGIFQWMVRTGKNYPPVVGRWVSCGVTALLSTQPTCGFNNDTHDIYSLDNLRKRFHWAILSRLTNSCTEKWRAENDITPTGVKIIHFPHEGIYLGRERIEGLFQKAGPLTTQLNSSHVDAVEIHRVVARVGPSDIRFILDYGVDGSGWEYELAKTDKGEGFSGAFVRAEKRLLELTV